MTLRLVNQGYLRLQYCRENFAKNKRFLKGAFFLKHTLSSSLLTASLFGERMNREPVHRLFEQYRKDASKQSTQVLSVTSTFFQKEWKEVAFIANDFSWSSRASQGVNSVMCRNNRNLHERLLSLAPTSTSL